MLTLRTLWYQRGSPCSTLLFRARQKWFSCLVKKFEIKERDTFLHADEPKTFRSFFKEKGSGSCYPELRENPAAEQASGSISPISTSIPPPHPLSRPQNRDNSHQLCHRYRRAAPDRALTARLQPGTPRRRKATAQYVPLINSMHYNGKSWNKATEQNMIKLLQEQESFSAEVFQAAVKMTEK